MQNPNGSSSTPQQIEDTLTSYLTDIFQVQAHPIQQSIQSNEDSTDNHHTTASVVTYSLSTPTIEEIHNIIKSMHNNAAPRPDGINVAFYKTSWEWIKMTFVR